MATGTTRSEEINNAQGPLRIDLNAILRNRLSPAKYRMIPRFLIRGVERLIKQDELNGVLERTYPKRGTEFAVAALEDLGVKVEVRGLDNVPESGRFVFASNHPLGGLDGIALIAVLGAKYGDEHLRFPVNDLLMNVKPLDGIFTGINKFGRQGRASASCINEIYASDDKQVAIFPAGLVSRLGKRGVIADLTWQKAFVAKALEFDRDIIPVRIVAQNSMLFYRTARWRKRLHIGVNLEQVLLPSELFKASGSTITLIFGEPVTCHELRSCRLKPMESAAKLREKVYCLK